MADNRTNSDQFQLRLPPGLRDRIKAYAESKGRSTNAEIVRILEREFPAPETLASTVHRIREMINQLEKGFDEASVGALERELENALRGVVSGQVYDFPDSAYSEVKAIVEKWEEQKVLDDRDLFEESLDDEEYDNRSEFGTTAKIVFPEERQKLKKPRKKFPQPEPTPDDPFPEIKNKD